MPYNQRQTDGGDDQGNIGYLSPAKRPKDSFLQSSTKEPARYHCDRSCKGQRYLESPGTGIEKPGDHGAEGHQFPVGKVHQPRYTVDQRKTH